MKRFYYFSQQRYAKSEMQTDYMYPVVKLDLFNFTTLFSFEIDFFCRILDLPSYPEKENKIGNSPRNQL